MSKVLREAIIFGTRHIKKQQVCVGRTKVRGSS